MDITKSKALIFGAGSIGERHINNLLQLGCSAVIVYRQRNLPLRNVDEKKITIVTSLDEALLLKPDFAVICSPTAQHAQQTLFCIQQGIPVLVEKPLSNTLSDLQVLKQAIKEKGTLVHVGYMMRFHPLLQFVKNGLNENKWGKLIYIRTYWGEYLPNWHPWEDYRISYAAKKELGGGAALTLSHDIDLVNWLVASPLKKSCTMHSFASSLEVEVDSAADIQLAFENQVQAHVHVNFFQKTARREYQIECEDASLLFDFFLHRLTITTPQETTVKDLPSFDRNDMFLAQSQYFVDLITHKDFTNYSINQIEDSELIIKTCEHE
jgi:predicted dehydrogenase